MFKNLIYQIVLICQTLLQWMFSVGGLLTSEGEESSCGHIIARSPGHPTKHAKTRSRTPKSHGNRWLKCCLSTTESTALSCPHSASPQNPKPILSIATSWHCFANLRLVTKKLKSRHPGSRIYCKRAIV